MARQARGHPSPDRGQRRPWTAQPVASDVETDTWSAQTSTWTDQDLASPAEAYGHDTPWAAQHMVRLALPMASQTQTSLWSAELMVGPDNG
jgi:hypothetical protein